MEELNKMIEEIKSVLAKQLEMDKSTLTEDTKIIEDLKLDSLDLVELLMTLEDTFGIEVADEDAEKMKSIKDVANFIIEKQK